MTSYVEVVSGLRPNMRLLIVIVMATLTLGVGEH